MKKRFSLILLAASICCLVLAGCSGSSDDHENELHPPLSASDCKGENYQEVISAFEDAGFSHISTEVLDDLIIGWLTSDGEVESVAIDGNDDFSEDDWVSKENEIVVTYHTFPNDGNGESDQPETSGEASPPPESNSEPTATPVPEPPESSAFSVHYIDVGQADAALLECDGHYMLIDGGNKDDSDVIYTVLKNAGVSKLDIVVGTHAHEDHIGGIPGAFNCAAAELTLCPVTEYDSDAFDDFARYTDEKGGGITVPAVGDTYALGSAEVTVLGVNGGSSTNDTSIVLRVQYGETSFLFTGDAEREAEQAILDSGADLSATVLKVGHHGSETSTTYPFLRAIMPRYAVISVGEDNSYGHPDDDTLSRLRDADVEVYRTDLHGDIFMTSDGKTVLVSTDKNASSGDVMAPGGSTAAATPVPTQTSEPTPGPTAMPTPKPTPEPTPGPEQPAANEIMVWIPKSGSKYHSYSGCSNMKNPTQVTKSQAEGMGYTPCKKCW